MKKCYFISIFILLITTSYAFSEPEGITLTKTSAGYNVAFVLPQYEMVTTTVEDEEYISLVMSGYGIVPETGLPALPLISFNLFISYNEEQPQVTIMNKAVSEETLPNKIFPFQAPWEKTQPLSERPFTINNEYYNSTGKYYPAITVSEPFIIGGVKGVIVTINPFNYNPIEDKLTVVTSGNFEISLEYPVLPITNKSQSFNNFYNKIFVNYEGDGILSSMNYLIITAPAFETGLATFVSYKNSTGFNVDLFNTNVTGTTTTSIKSFIQNRYNNPGTKPEFILLVGDVGDIPAWTGSGAGTPTTDLNYAQLEGGDYFADAFIGRFSVTTTNELQNAISKTIFMDTYVGTLTKKNIFMASTDNYQISEGTHNYVIDNYFDPAGYTYLKLYTYTYNATTQQLIDALNDNQLFAIYSGHGGEYSWADGPPLSQAQVMALTNTWFPYVYSFACVTGSYHVSECFGETWLRTENGASTFYGSSVNSYWDEDDILERKIFYSMFEDDLTRVTPMFDQGKMYLVNHYGGITGTTLRYLEMYNLMGDPSMAVTMQIPPDTTPPDPITDLTTVNPTSNSITLNWTAPFDSTFGGIATYDIRYSTSNITNENEFNNAPQMLLTGQSDSAGTPKVYTIDELSFNTTYYFAIKAMDIWDNTSEMSNVPSNTTYYAPELSLNCDSMHCVVLPNATFTDSIIISNVSTQNSTLDYLLELTNSTFPDNVQIQLIGMNETVNSTVGGTKEFPIKVNGFSFKGSGGPDPFGYKWKDSNEPNGPAYVWNDITSDPNAVQITNWQGTLDDGYTGAIPIGFEFEFYGTAYTNVYVSTNGFISFSSLTSAYYTNDPIPNSGEPNNIICPIWDDLDGRTQGTVHYLPDGSKFILQFTNWQRYSGTGSLTFQVVLNSNDRINFYYNNLVGDLTSSTIGIENNDGSIGLQIANNATYLENELAIQIAADPEWLSLSNLGGTLYNGTSAAIVLNIDTDDLELGDYSMDMVVTSNDPNNLEVTIPITMTVTNEIPVELVSLVAENILDEVILKWQTASETNNMGFEVEKGEKSIVNGQTDWNKVGFINGSGTTTERMNYIFKEKISKPGIYLYRLKQIDFDGTVAYSPEVEIDVTGPKEFALFQNYPNPFNPVTTIKFSLPKQADVKLVVYNAVGQVVEELINETMEEGYHEVQFTADDFASGVYYYRLNTSEFNSIKKMLLLK
ncbi:MAG: hypothetical protein DRQ13_03095 [Ignavibacteriae bacterium]|nr:MAG: hypothetical protein DRQ13_03095 [Ignavibacteriota bacterium]